MIGQTKPTIHVLLDYVPADNRLESYWRECFKDDDFKDYNINLIDGAFTRHESYLWSDTFFKTQQLKNLMDLFSKNSINNGDIFIFTNAWNFVAVPLSYFRYEFELDIKVIGFWGNSLFNQYSPMWKRFKKKHKKWGRDFELALYRAYDLNCYFSEEHLDLFRKKYPNHDLERNKYAVTGYPFGYLAKNIPNKEKIDQVIFPYPVKQEYQSQVIKGLGSEIKYNFVFPRETHNNRWEYLQLLRESKAMFCPNHRENDPVLLYEGMVNGLIPFVPDKEFYHHIVPSYYYYPNILSTRRVRNRFLFAMRNRIELEGFVLDKLDNYNEWKCKVQEDAKVIGEKYYNNDKFITELKNL